MELVRMNRRGAATFNLSTREWDELDKELQARGVQMYSKDYCTAKLPIDGVYDAEGAAVYEFVMNKSYTLNGSVSALTVGRAFVSVNPALNEYFKDISFSSILEQGETLTFQARAKKNSNYEQLAKEVGWLFKCFVID